LSTRRRIYLLRHAEVAYFDEHGQPVAPDEVPLTPTGRRQAPSARVEQWPELRELVPGRLAELAPEELEAAFLGAFRGVLPGPTRPGTLPWPCSMAG
jgi:broad specificity phosphatase PhoE